MPFPDEVDGPFPTAAQVTDKKLDGSDSAFDHPEAHEDLGDAIVAIETYLLDNPIGGDPPYTASPYVQLHAQAEVGQTDPLLVLKDENGASSFGVVSRLADDDIWVIDGVASAPIVADAGGYVLGSDFLDPAFGNAIAIVVGDDEAAVQAAVDAALGAGNATVAGDWSSFTLTVIAVGQPYSADLYVNGNTLTYLGNPVSDPAVANTTPGHGGCVDLLGPYGNAIGRVTDAGLFGTPTLFDPASHVWDQSGYASWLWSNTQVRDLLGFGPGDVVDVQRIARRTNVARSGEYSVQAYSDTGNEYVQFTSHAGLNADGSMRDGYFAVHNDLNDAGLDPVIWWGTNDTYTQARVKALPGQTAPLLDLKDADGNDIFTVAPDGQFTGGSASAGHWLFQHDASSTTLRSAFGAYVQTDLDTEDDGTTRSAAWDMRARADAGGNHQAVVAFDSQINADSTFPLIRMRWDTQIDEMSGSGYTPLILESNVDHMRLMMQAVVAQTDSILDLKGENGNDIFTVAPADSGNAVTVDLKGIATSNINMYTGDNVDWSEASIVGHLSGTKFYLDSYLDNNDPANSYTTLFLRAMAGQTEPLIKLEDEAGNQVLTLDPSFAVGTAMRMRSVAPTNAGLAGVNLYAQQDPDSAWHEAMVSGMVSPSGALNQIWWIDSFWDADDNANSYTQLYLRALSATNGNTPIVWVKDWDDNTLLRLWGGTSPWGSGGTFYGNTDVPAEGGWFSLGFEATYADVTVGILDGQDYIEAYITADDGFRRSYFDVYSSSGGTGVDWTVQANSSVGQIDEQVHVPNNRMARQFQANASTVQELWRAGVGQTDPILKLLDENGGTLASVGPASVEIGGVSAHFGSSSDYEFSIQTNDNGTARLVNFTADVSGDSSGFVEAYSVAQINNDGTAGIASFAVDGNSTGYAKMELRDDEGAWILGRAVMGQTQPLIDLRDENGTTVFSVLPDGTFNPALGGSGSSASLAEYLVASEVPFVLTTGGALQCWLDFSNEDLRAYQGDGSLEVTDIVAGRLFLSGSGATAPGVGSGDGRKYAFLTFNDDNSQQLIDQGTVGDWEFMHNGNTTVFLVGKYYDETPIEIFMQVGRPMWGDNNAGWELDAKGSGAGNTTSRLEVSAADSDWGGVALQTYTTAAATWELHVVETRTAASVATRTSVFLDGTEIVHANTEDNDASSGAATTPLTIGSAYSDLFLHGAIAEILIFNGIPTDAERKTIEGYLRRKWFDVDTVETYVPSGILAIGADTSLYRLQANVLKTEDTLFTTRDLYAQKDHTAAQVFIGEFDTDVPAIVFSTSFDTYWLRAGSALMGTNGGIRFDEHADFAAPAANKATVYCRDNGSGKTQIVARFPSGAVQVMATEP